MRGAGREKGPRFQPDPDEEVTCGIPCRLADMSQPHRPELNTSAVTVLLTNEQTATLDEIAIGIRRTTGHSISRSAMIRAITTAVLPYCQEWLDC
jgi:hypothetical protein